MDTASSQTAQNTGATATTPPAAAATLTALLSDRLQRHANLPACVCMGRTMSHAQWDALSAALAAYFVSEGLQRGDRVALLLPNVPQLLVAVAAVLRAGGVLVNLNPASGLRELQHQIKDSGARMAVVIDTEAARLQPALESPALKRVVVTGLGDLLGPVKGALVNQWMRRVQRAVPALNLPSVVSLSTALAAGRHRPAPALPELLPDDIALIQYTGGTTGAARGAVLLHRHLVANVQQAAAWMAPALARLPAGEQWVTVGALPLHHIFGFTLVLLLGLHHGACTLLLPNPHDVDGMIKVLARHRFHGFPAVAPMFHAVASHPEVDKVDWSALRLSLAGAVAVPASTALLWVLKTGSPICQGYGLSEASPAVTCNPVDDTPFSGHLGQPLPGTELRLIDDDGHPVPAGTPGEIAVRGPQVMAGYWQRPEETARAMTRDGFLRTGDIGVLGADGALRLVDRKKDVIFVSGFNVYPNEIEDVASQLPGVRDCAAVAMPDDKVGEVVKLVMVKADPHSTSPSEAEVLAHCAVHLAGYKRPRVVEFRSELPRTAVGKVLRRALRD